MKFKKKNIKVDDSTIERFDPDFNVGLSKSQIQSRVDNHLVNYDTTIKSKSYTKIVTSNLFTLFNGINIFLAVILFTQGSYKNAMFMGVVVLNLLIAIIQEIRAKKTIDKLTLLAETKAKCIRDGNKEEVGIHDLVLDDIILLETGNQVPSDCILVDGSCECNESLLTGESDAITKKPGDQLFSGSFIVSGRCYARVDKIAADNYVHSILKGAKYIKQTKSDIMMSLNKIIRFVTIIILPIGLAFFFSQLLRQNVPLKSSIEKTVASLIGMIPEGLMLLASTIFAVSVVRLSKHKVMVQDLYCTETLARVDTLCLDKTGTITEGTMELAKIVSLGKGISESEIKNVLRNLSAALTDNNPTIDAIRLAMSDIPITHNPLNVVPFSSKQKWSGATFDDGFTYILGAAEFVLPSVDKSLQNKLDALSVENRVLLLVKTEREFKNGNEKPALLKPIALVAIRDKVRETAPETLKYFEQEGVDIKIISGDNVVTVSNIAKRAGVKNYDKYIDLSTLKTEEEVREAALEYAIFGRVTPDQKKILVTALKDAGRTVAMTGDGVNDVLALKEADCSIAMASGAEAAKNVSQLVLLDSNFASMPKVVQEGRRSINNLQLSGSLFLVKTTYSMLLTLLLLILNKSYPLVSIQLTLINALAVGIPAFFIALEPNKDRLQGRFITNIFRRALPGGLTIALGLLIVTGAMSYLEHGIRVTDGVPEIYKLTLLNPNGSVIYFGQEMFSKYTGTIAIIVVSVVHFFVLFDIARPFTLRRVILFFVMVIAFIVIIFVTRDITLFGKARNIFEIYDLNSVWLHLILTISIFSVFAIYYILREMIQKLLKYAKDEDGGVKIRHFKKLLEDSLTEKEM